MKTTNRPYQLEETVPGIFLLQGWLGGALGGFIYAVAGSLWTRTGGFNFILVLTPVAMVVAGILGVIKGTIMWGVYRLTGVRMGAFARVVVSSIAAYVLAVFMSAHYGGRNEDVAAWLILMLSGAIPTALLVGSNVKPWELLTFGSIVVDGRRAGSSSVLATLGTLPLRFLSLTGLAVWILLYSCRRPYSAPSVSSELEIISFLVPAIYFALTAYLTFRSPGKPFLPVWAIFLNLYAGFYAFFFSLSYTNSRWPGDEEWMLSVTARAFIIGWAIFLIARLAAPMDDGKPLTILPPAPARAKVVEHQCLGTRFAEWQKHVA